MVSQHYWPESFINTDICETLVERGHEVTVLTGLPNYPDGVIPEEYRNRKNRVQKQNGVDIIRVPLITRGRDLRGFNKVRRAANYVTFWFFGSRKAKRLSSDFDVVLSCQTSPVTMSGPGVSYSRKFGAKVLLYCCDLSPADLLVGGITEKSFVYKLYLDVSKRIYGAASIIGISSPLFRKYLCDVVGVDNEKIVFQPQFAEDIFAEGCESIELDDKTCSLFNPSKVNLMFAGNVGNYQAVETIVYAASELKNDERICFHIVGSGSRLESCKRIAAENHLDNIVFHGQKPLDMMPAYYKRADAMLMTFCDNRDYPVVSYTLPRKTQTYLAVGKPVIAAIAGEAAHVIEEAKCGYCCDAEDYIKLAALCTRFAITTPDERLTMIKNSRTYYEEHYSKGKFFDNLEKDLTDLRSKRA